MYRVFFLLFCPNFSAKKKNVVQSSRIFCTSGISWNRISDWLPIIFQFGTENWEEQLKKITLHDMQEREPFRQAGRPAIPLKETADAISFPQLPLFHHLSPPPLVVTSDNLFSSNS